MTTRDVAIGGIQKKRRVVQNLFPGIPDDIILCEIVSKLEWKDFFILACVSHAWCDAIRGGRIFHSRVLSRSRETVVAIYYDDDRRDVTRNFIALYSMRGNSWHKLPPIPNIREGRHGIPALGQCISMDEKIYVIGGMVNFEISSDVFVFDVARQGHWRQCASMNQSRIQFGSALFDGKFYVFGGKIRTFPHDSGNWGFNNYQNSKLTAISDSEVYDPKEDTWSAIRSMETSGYVDHVSMIGEELFLYLTPYPDEIPLGSWECRTHVYHPFKGKWRFVDRYFSWIELNSAAIFSFQGNMFSLQRERDHTLPGPFDFTQRHIYKYDIDGDSWIYMHSFKPFTAFTATQMISDLLWPDVILVAGEELIALVNCEERRGERVLMQFQSRGFNSESRQISWTLRGTTLSPVEDKAYYCRDVSAFTRKYVVISI